MLHKLCNLKKIWQNEVLYRVGLTCVTKPVRSWRAVKSGKHSHPHYTYILVYHIFDT